MNPLRPSGVRLAAGGAILFLIATLARAGGGLFDPFIAKPWSPTGATQDYFGSDVAPAGDVDGDGYGDLLVARGREEATPLGVQLFRGGPSGPDQTPDWSFGTNQLTTYAVAPAGDVNGDGYGDVVVGLSFWDTATLTDAGRIVVFHGGPSGLPVAPTYQRFSPIAAALQQFGSDVATAGDVNADGYDDVLVGANHYSDGTFPSRGAAFVFHGGPSGLAATPARTLLGPAENGSFGSSVAGAGDVDGDGDADILIGALGSSAVFANGGAASLYLGSPTGVAAVADTVLRGKAVNDFFGISVANAGDVNGDNYADVLVGASATSPQPGRAELYFGGPQGIASSVVVPNAQALANEHFGSGVATLGDLDGDGFADFGVSASNQPGGHGRVAVYRGSPAGAIYVGEVLPPGDAAIFGYSFAASGDVNGDGFSEIVVGDPFWSNSRGRMHLYAMPRSLPALAPGWPIVGPQPGTGYGSALAIVPQRVGSNSAVLLIGDPGFNGVGRVDFHEGRGAQGINVLNTGYYLGTTGFQNFGRHLVDIGDADRADLSDFIVASPTLDVGAFSQAGRVDFYPGDFFTLPPSQPVISGGGDFERVGSALAGRGDVNGDGYHDLLVGAPEWDSPALVDCGKVWLFYGSPSGPVPSPWSAQGTTIYQGLGASIAFADFDGDAYTDVVVGANTPSGGTPVTSQVRVYYGGPTGLSTVAGTVLGHYISPGPSFGFFVASVGDVDGDGIGEVGIGAPEGLGRGVFYLYRGQGSRPQSPLPTWVRQGTQTGGRLGACFAGRGDVDGDGYGDLVLGEPGWTNGQTSEGRFLLFYGRAGFGATTQNDFAYESNVLGAQLGTSFADLGDVNGDGFADVIAGAPGAAGRVYAFLGGGGAGELLRTTLLEIGASGNERRFHPAWLQATDRVYADLVLRSAAGRSRVTYALEVVPHLEAFTGTPSLVGDFLYDTGTPGTDPVVFPVVFLPQAGTAYRLHGRLVSRSPYFPRTRWVSPEAHASGDHDVSTAGVSVGVPPNAPLVADRARLVGVAPNPTLGTSDTRIRFTLPEASRATVDVYDVRGAHVCRVLDETVPAGLATCVWDGRDTKGRTVRTGIYFVVLRAGGAEDRSRVVSVR